MIVAPFRATPGIPVIYKNTILYDRNVVTIKKEMNGLYLGMDETVTEEDYSLYCLFVNFVLKFIVKMLYF